MRYARWLMFLVLVAVAGNGFAAVEMAPPSAGELTAFPADDDYFWVVDSGVPKAINTSTLFGPSTATNVAAALSAGNPRVVVTPGSTLTLTAPLAVATAGQELILTGVTIDASGSATDGIRITGAGARVIGGTINDAPRYGVYAYDAARPEIRNVTVVDSGNIGIFYEVTSSGAAGTAGPIIEGCTVDRSSLGATITEGGIKVHADFTAGKSVLRSQLRNNTVLLPNDASGSDVIGVESWGYSHHAAIVGNTLVGGYTGISLAQADHNSITGNTIYDANTWGIEVAASDNTAISGNTIDGNGNTSDGIILTIIGSIYSNHTTISGNTITGCTSNTIQANSSSDGLTISGNTLDETAAQYAINLSLVQNFTISGNTLEGNSTGTKGVMLDRTYDGVISGNMFSNFTENGVLIYSASASDVLDNIIISTNTFKNCASTVLTQLSGGAALGNNVKILGNIGQSDFLDYKNAISRKWGTGSPEASVTGSPGSTYQQYDGTTGVLWTKQAGTGNTGWRLVDGHAILERGDVDATLTAGTSSPVQVWNTTLTSNRTVTLSATGAVEGDRFRVVRTGLGAYTLDVGGLKTIPNSTTAWVDVEWDGSAWILTGYGTL